jgi:hypothetical protein
MNLLEETTKICKDWFEANSVEIPKTAREWQQKGRSGVTVPPGCTYATLRKKGIKVGDLLELLNPTYTNRIKNFARDLDFIEKLGLKFLSVKDTETVYFECLNCKKESNALKGTLRRWEAKNLRYCSICRKASGKEKSIEYYQKFLDKNQFSILDTNDPLKIKHNICGHEFFRSRGYITGAQRASNSLVECPKCSEKRTFIYDKTKFNSLTEAELIPILLDRLKVYGVEREVLYKDIMSTDRNFRVDLWVPSLFFGVEITSKNNNLKGYQDRLQEKLKLAKSNNITIFTVSSINDIEDIVRTLPKGKES